MMRVRRAAPVLLLVLTFVPGAASAQGTVADYQRAMTLREAWQSLAVGVPDTPTWIGRTNRFWFRRSVQGGNEFVVVNSDTKAMAPPFDHARLAAALSTAAVDKHNKDFDLLVVPGMDHGSGGAYGDHKRYDFFVRNLLGVAPPDWKTIEEATKKKTTTTSVD